MMLSIIDNILYLSDTCIDEKMEYCKAAGISRQESKLLLSIKPGDSITCGEAAKRINLSPSRVSRIVDNLIDKGYLERQISPSDRRSIEISLTGSGRNCRDLVENGKALCEKKLREQLNDKELKTINEALDMLLKVMGDDNAGK